MVGVARGEPPRGRKVSGSLSPVALLEAPEPLKRGFCSGPGRSATSVWAGGCPGPPSPPPTGPDAQQHLTKGHFFLICADATWALEGVDCRLAGCNRRGSAVPPTSWETPGKRKVGLELINRSRPVYKALRRISCWEGVLTPPSSCQDQSPTPSPCPHDGAQSWGARRIFPTCSWGHGP